MSSLLSTTESQMLYSIKTYTRVWWRDFFVATIVYDAQFPVLECKLL